MAIQREAEGNSGGRAAAPGGIIVLNKPSGPTSRELVDRVARLLPRTKVGHAGTLDPLASGILIICFGTATRLTDEIHDLSKSYRTVVRLGARSDTHDAQGLIVAVEDPPCPGAFEIEEALKPLRGPIMQQPPEHSALKIKGKRAYDLARAGRAVPLLPRLVQIDRIEVLGYTWPHLELEIDCSKGTYIRSIARDLGDALGCGGYVLTLERTRIGKFTLEEAVAPEALGADSIGRLFRPSLEAVGHLRRVVLDDASIAAITQGRTIALPEIDVPDQPAGLLALVDQNSRLVALAELDALGKLLQPRKVLIS
jgi:tRNA pseudouridine55 synthase